MTFKWVRISKEAVLSYVVLSSGENEENFNSRH